MRNVKFGIVFVGLVLAVGGAVTLAAQDRFEVGPRGRADVRVFGAGGQLGIRVSDTADGVRVDNVNEGSAADKAGLREGDLVLEFDGERVRSAMQLTRLVRETPDGRAVNVAVMRDGKRQTLQATPESGADFTFDFDGDRLRDDLERSLRDFRMDPHSFDFKYGDRPRRFEYRLPDVVRSYLGGRARLGVTVQSITPELGEYFGATNGGVLVSSVASDSAGAKAGLKAGDVITSINGDRVSDPDDLMRTLSNLSGEVTIVVLRDKKELTLKATLGRD